MEKSTLNITVVRCQGLPARDSNVGSSDPYVKLQLLPDKHHKVKTRVLRRTLNPVYDEDFTFYGIGENQLEVEIYSMSFTHVLLGGTVERHAGSGLVMAIYDRHYRPTNFFFVYFQSLTLHFVVLCFDRYSRDDVIGEVLLPVNEALEEMTDSVDSNNTADNGKHSGALLFRDIAPRSHKVSPPSRWKQT